MKKSVYFSLILCLIALISCNNKHKNQKQPPPFTNMKDNLAAIAREDSTPYNATLNDQAVEYYKKKLRTEGQEQYLINLFNLSHQYMMAGMGDSAIESFRVFKDSLK